MSGTLCYDNHLTTQAVVDDDTTAIVLYDFYSELVGATWITPKATINFGMIGG